MQKQIKEVKVLKEVLEFDIKELESQLITIEQKKKVHKNDYTKQVQLEKDLNLLIEKLKVYNSEIIEPVKKKKNQKFIAKN